MPDGGTVAAVVLTLLVLTAAVIIFLIYLYHRKKKRFPWQKNRGKPYTAPVANYHEIENIRSERLSRNNYDYAEPEVVFTNLGEGNRNDEEYDHLGDKISVVHSQYDTTASAAQAISRSLSQENPHHSKGQYRSLNVKPDSKVMHNAYEVVIPPGQAPRSPDSTNGSSADYNYLTAPQKQTVIQSEYDIATSQPPSSPTEEVTSTSGVKKSSKNKPGKPTPRKRSHKNKGETPKSNRGYELAKLPDDNSASSRKNKNETTVSNKNYDSAQLPNAKKTSSRMNGKETSESNKVYDLAKLLTQRPSCDESNDVAKLKSDGGYVETIIVGDEASQPKASTTNINPNKGNLNRVHCTTSLVDNVHDNGIDETQLYDVPVTGGSVDNGQNGDDIQHYSVASPSQSINDTHGDSNQATPKKRKKPTGTSKGASAGEGTKLATQPGTKYQQITAVNGKVGTSTGSYEYAKSFQTGNPKR